MKLASLADKFAPTMRIIAGKFKRHSLHSPQGYKTRPTTDRTRESLFNLVRSRVSLVDAEVLDLFAGTGALGLEAMSRGARFVTFVEQDPEVLEFARRNARELGVEDQALFIQQDAVSYLRQYSGPKLDLILVDPPYQLEEMRELPDLALQHLKPYGVATLEHDTHHFFDEHPNLDTSRPYGRTIVSVFLPDLNDEPDEASGEKPTEEES